LLIEVKGLEADYFAYIESYLHRLLEADARAQVKFCANSVTGAFLAAAVAPGATRSACIQMRRFYDIDACHIKSQFSMMLMVAVGIDANDNILPLAWAVVPTKNER
jgi:hypothetical protein